MMRSFTSSSPGVVGVEHGSGGDEVVVVGRAPPPRDLEHGVEPRADPARLLTLLAGSFEAVDLLGDGLAHGLGHAVTQRVEAGAVLGDHIVVAVAELALDGGELAPKHGLPLGAIELVADLAVDAPDHLGLDCRLFRPFGGEREPAVDLGRLEQLEPTVVGELGPPGDGVGEGAGVDHVVEQPGHAAAADGGEQAGGGGAVRRGELPGGLGGWGDLDLADRHEQGAVVGEAALAHVDPGEAAHDHTRCAVGERSSLLDAGEGADRGARAVVAGHQHDMLVDIDGGGRGPPGLVGLEPDGHHHLGQDDSGGRNEGQAAGVGGGGGHGISLMVGGAMGSRQDATIT